MSMFLITFSVFMLAIMSMAIGVIINNRAIKGSCGGLNDIDGLDGACDICEIKEQCKRLSKAKRELRRTQRVTLSK